MIEQVKTIRAGLETATCYSMLGVDAHSVQIALTALTQLEAMVGEPVAWAVYWGLPPTRKNSVHFDMESAQAVANQIKSSTEVRPLYTAPPAQQYEAGDIASASAQGFRDGVASVAQQPQKLEDSEQYRMQMAGICTAATGYWKVGDSIHPDYDTPALREVAKLHAKYDALYKAQQPQARPDFTDEWNGYLKDGETPFERFLRERKDLTTLTKLYQRALEENERLKGQQPQAEAVPSDVVRDANIEAAAKKMAEIFDYPWDFMPEKGRNTMRENVRTVLDAAIAQPSRSRKAVPNIDRMAGRLMSWPLPKDFHPDGRIGFDRIGLDALGYPRGWPTGTNLLTHEQAKAMFEYVLEAKP